MRFVFVLAKKHLNEVGCDEVEWFVQMVEERKKNNDHKKEKKNW